MPLNKDLRNNGLTYSAPTGYGDIVDGGQFGKVLHTSTAGSVNTQIKSVDGWDISSGSCGFGAWLKFNLNELRTASAYTYTSSYNCLHNVVLGFNSYGGISLDLTSNNIYNDGAFNSATLQAHLRYDATASSAARAIELDKWHHWYVQYSKERGKLELYYDGALTSSAVTTGVTITALDKYFMINNGTVWGGNPPGKYLSYYVSDVRVYNHVLTADEVKEIAKHKMFDVEGDRQNISTAINYASVANTETGMGWSAYGFGGRGKSYRADDITPKYCGNVIKILASAGTGTYSAEAARWFSGPRLTNGGKMTFSFYAKGEGSTIGKSVTAHMYNNSGSTTVSTGKSGVLTSEWKRYKHTLTWTGELSSAQYSCYIVIGGATQNDYIYACNFQLEEGDKASKYHFSRGIKESQSDAGGRGHVMLSTNVIKSGSTLYFSGADNCTMPTANMDFMKIVDQVYTFSFWVNNQESNSSRSIFWGSGGYVLNIEKAASTNYLRVYNLARPDWHVSGCVITPNQWIHVAVAKSGTTVTVYKNGVNVGTNDSFVPHASYDTTYYLGSDTRTGDVKYKGYMNDFKIYATCLSSDDIAAIYNKERVKYQ